MEHLLEAWPLKIFLAFFNFLKVHDAKIIYVISISPLPQTNPILFHVQWYAKIIYVSSISPLPQTNPFTVLATHVHVRERNRPYKKLQKKNPTTTSVVEKAFRINDSDIYDINQINHTV